MATRPSTTSTTPSPPATISPVQRVWDSKCCEVQADLLLDAAADVVERARLLASRAPESGDWLHVLPLSSVGLKLDNATVRISAGLRLGAPVVRPHICVCGAMVTADGHHGLSCRRGSGRHSRHNQINNLLCRAFVSSRTSATRKPQGLCTGSGKRPDGVTQIPWSRGRCLAWDATRTHLQNLTFRRAVHVPVQRQKRRKRRKLRNTPISLQASTSFQWQSRLRELGVSGASTSSGRLANELRR